MDVSVRLPVVEILPVPVISCEFKSSPPSNCTPVSFAVLVVFSVPVISTVSVIDPNELGTAPSATLPSVSNLCRSFPPKLKTRDGMFPPILHPSILVSWLFAFISVEPALFLSISLLTAPPVPVLEPDTTKSFVSNCEVPDTTTSPDASKLRSEVVLIVLSEPSWKMDKSVPAPKFSLSSDELALSPKLMFFALTSRLPPS